MTKAFLIPPLLGALVFTVPEFLQLMHRPDSIYIPVLFEGLLFAAGYLIYGIINAIIITPLCKGPASITTSRIAGLLLPIAVAVLGSVIAFSFELLGHKPAIIHRDYLFGAFLPLFAMTMASFYFVASHRKAKSGCPSYEGTSAGGGPGHSVISIEESTIPTLRVNHKHLQQFNRARGFCDENFS